MYPARFSSSLRHVNAALSRGVKILHVLWYFTESDFSTFVIPNTAFGLLSALAASPLIDFQNDSASASKNAFVVLFYNWSNLLIFDLANQWTPESIAEDHINKPWRPIPSKMITGDQTRRAMLVAIPISLGINYYLNVWTQGVFIHLITWLYNDIRGSDEPFVREILIAGGYAMFNSGSLKIAAGCHQDLVNCEVNRSGWVWTCIISAVILTTMQIQDLKDQEGDRLRKRKTVVLFLGERVSRGSIAFFIIVWSVVCAFFWGPGLVTFGATLVPGVYVSWQVLWAVGQRADRRAWKSWCMWLVCLYMLPLFGPRYSLQQH